MAIAITLLILNVHIDATYASDHGLLRALNHEWPAYLAYITAFLTIAIMWLNHHALFDKIKQVDKSLAWTNLALLLTISVLPFPTSVVAQYLRAGGTDAKVAVSFYGLLSMLNGFAWLGSWVHLARYPELLDVPYDAAYARLERRRTAMGVATYAFATAIAWLAPMKRCRSWRWRRCPRSWTCVIQPIRQSARSWTAPCRSRRWHREGWPTTTRHGHNDSHAR